MEVNNMARELVDKTKEKEHMIKMACPLLWGTTITTMKKLQD